VDEIIKLVRTYRFTDAIDERIRLAEEIFRLIEPDLRLFVHSGISRNVAEDASQETLAAAAKSLKKFEGDTPNEAPSPPRESLAYSDVVKEIYLGIMERPVDESGFNSHLHALKSGGALSNLIRGMINSDEFQTRHPIATGRGFLPDLTKLYPDKYVRKEKGFSLFRASSDEDFFLLESLIAKHRFYETNDVYSHKINLDKRITAAIVQGLGGRSCVEMGCFSGHVLSLLADQDIDVCGIDVSHLAFVLAYKNIRDKLRYGDLLDLKFDRTYDVFLGMDILEHLNPLKLGSYIDRIAQLVDDDGFIYINSPMFGEDDVFGKVADTYVPEWEQEGNNVFWRHIHCDEKGWPVHGHLVLASPVWWENIFRKHGFVRDRDIEREIHSILKHYFDELAPARRTLFVLKRPNSKCNVESIKAGLNAALSPLVPAHDCYNSVTKTPEYNNNEPVGVAGAA
jgi:SAM-dependent methyltransferase